MKYLLLSVLLLSGCTDESGARSALDNQGFTDVQLTGWGNGCSDSDATATGFNATNSNGKRVSGVVCCGYSKGCTIRW